MLPWRSWARWRHDGQSRALVLTITMVVVQLAMGQFSPRIVQRILEDKPSQLAIGIFVGTFAHSVIALREVQTGDDGVVPGLAVVIAFVLVIVSIMVTFSRSYDGRTSDRSPLRLPAAARPAPFSGRSLP
jgi:hypothetical protein